MNQNQIVFDDNAKLTSDRLKIFLNLIDQEFANKDSLFHHNMEREKNIIVVKYREDVGYADLKKAYDKACDACSVAERKRDEAKKAIANVGLDIHGEPDSTSTYNYELQRHVSKPKAIKLKKLLDTVEKNAPSSNLKAKITSAMTCATTIGQAKEIMRQVLGNGVWLPKGNANAMLIHNE